MLKNILHKLGTLSTNPSIDPASFEDPVALKTEWTPAKGGGANFRTHKLIEVDSTRIEFRASIGAKLFYTVLMIMGIGATVVFSFGGFSNETSLFDTEVLVPCSSERFLRSWERLCCILAQHLLFLTN